MSTSCGRGPVAGSLARGVVAGRGIIWRQRPPTNVAPVLLAVEVRARHGVVRRYLGPFDGISKGCHAQYPTARCLENTVVQARTGMKDDTFAGVGGQTGDWVTGAWCGRIVGCSHN